MTKLFIPSDLLKWIDENRGDLSRQAFIIKCIGKVKEIMSMKV